MTKSHNKKRNTGIIYELLLRSIASSLISDNKKRAQTGLQIIEDQFDKSTEVYREFRLFNALAKSTVSSSSVAAGILSEARAAARRCDFQKLNREKSCLIREINRELKDDNFYHRRLPDYKIYATIQTLLNDWRDGDGSNLKRMVEFEGKMIDWLLQEKISDSSLSSQISENVDNLVVKIMTDKFNDRYGKTLIEEQKDIVKSYVFSISTDDGTSIRKKLDNIKEETLVSLIGFEGNTDNEVLLEKICDVRGRISDLDSADISDSSIIKHLVISGLRKELTEAIRDV